VKIPTDLLNKQWHNWVDIEQFTYMKKWSKEVAFGILFDNNCILQPSAENIFPPIFLLKLQSIIMESMWRNK